MAKAKGLQIDKLMGALVHMDGSDLHLAVGDRPMIRLHGRMHRLETKVLDPDDMVGFEIDLGIDYQYTEDLLLSAGWAHLFVDDAMEQSWGGNLNDDDIDYLYVEAQLTF